MCGIAGFYNVRVTTEQINRITGSLLHRGPDDQHSFSKDTVGFIHTRLSIIDLSERGAQPYHFENLSLVFNGELYNYREVKQQLQAKGYTFHSDSDTEVLIKAFHCWREACVNRFVGMFAFSVYDHTDKTLWLFRDRLGVKPLYYSINNGSLRFASELKALCILETDKTIDQHALFYYFRFGFVPGSHSIFKAIKKLQAGHYLKMTATTVEEKQYWTPSGEVNHSKTERQWLDELEELMISSFRYRMVSDVPVGVFLSGGIDSSLLSAVLKKHHGPIHSFTIGFEETGFDESVYAKQVADHLKLEHTEKKLQLAEAKSILDKFYDIYDEPFADTSGIPTACVTQLAKQAQVKVVLSADGGDELFGGYPHYQRANRLYRQFSSVPSSARKAVSGILETVAGKRIRKNVYAFNAEHKLYALEELLRAKNPANFFEAYLANQSVREIQNLTGFAPAYPYLSDSLNGTPYQQMMHWDIENYLANDLLVKVDRATMFHSVECREPFLDHRLVEFSETIPDSLKIKNGEGKYIVKRLLERYLPASLVDRKKQGFSIPIFQWFNTELDQLFEVHLSAQSLSRIDCLNSSEVLHEYQKYKAYKSRGKAYNIEKMWRILSFILWWNKYVGQ